VAGNEAEAVLKLAVLLGVLCAIGAIQLLPQVDLPDTALHADALRRNAQCAALDCFAIPMIVRPSPNRDLFAAGSEQSLVTFHLRNQLTPTQFSTLLC
jgi:hypothetical protein